MLIEITQALSSLKTISDLTTLIFKTTVDSNVTQKAIELQSAIISLQSAITSIQAQNYDLLQENHSLKQRLIDLERWDTEAQKYHLQKVADGVFVYASNQEQADTGPEHWLCVHCYGKKQKSILQRKQKTLDGTSYLCPNCKTEIVDHSNRHTISIA